MTVRFPEAARGGRPKDTVVAAVSGGSRMGDHFDRTGRRLAKAGGAEFVGWLLRLPAGAYRFHGWLDTRQARPPGEPDGAGDTVARVENTAAVGPDWMVLVEFQSEADPLMFGRMLVYLGTKWQEEKPNRLRGDRYSPGAAVVNLTGRGTTSRLAEWAEAGFRMALGVRERDLQDEDAGAELAGMEVGTIPRAGLPFVALMRGGADPAIIARWLALASAEPDAQRRTLWASSVLILSDAAGRRGPWKEALKEWDVKTSEQVLEWQAEARAEASAETRVQERARSVVQILTVRFGGLPPDLTAALALCDPDRLFALVEPAVTAPTLADFRQANGI